jgi:hypothetical protein
MTIPFFTFFDCLHFEEDLAIYLYTFELNSPNADLYKVWLLLSWLKLDQWFLQRFWITPPHFYILNIISTLARTWPFIGQYWNQFIREKNGPSLIDVGLLVLEKNVFKTFQCISTLLPLSTFWNTKFEDNKVWKGVFPFIWTNLNHLQLKMMWANSV